MSAAFPDLTDRLILVTGASRGIGAETAIAAAKAGAHVILLARTIGGLEEIDDRIRSETGNNATLMPLDLGKGDDLDKLGPSIADRFGRLDGFLANAGMLGTLGSLANASAKEWQRVFDVNCHANFRLIRTLDPLLRASEKGGRAVFLTSGMAHLCFAYWGMYASSKAALEAMVNTYAAEVASTDMKVNLLSPGLVDTKLLNKAYPGGYQGELPVQKPQDVAPLILPYLADECDAHGERISLSSPQGASRSGSSRT